jgi:hypothetical protein
MSIGVDLMKFIPSKRPHVIPNGCEFEFHTLQQLLSDPCVRRYAEREEHPVYKTYLKFNRYSLLSQDGHRALICEMEGGIWYTVGYIEGEGELGLPLFEGIPSDDEKVAKFKM